LSSKEFSFSIIKSKFLFFLASLPNMGLCSWNSIFP
jgi:hypothetical protein